VHALTRRFCSSSAVVMQAASVFETSLNLYQSARRYNPEDSHLSADRREDLKMYITRNSTREDKN
jgi:hypothetical protein